MHYEDDDSGHYLLAGAVLIGLGAFFALVALLVTFVIKLDLGFISGESMLVISVLMSGLGWMLRRDGYALREQAR